MKDSRATYDRLKGNVSETLCHFEWNAGLFLECRALFGMQGSFWNARLFLEGRALFGMQGSFWKGGLFLECRALFGREGSV